MVRVTKARAMTYIVSNFVVFMKTAKVVERALLRDNGLVDRKMVSEQVI